jgi:thiamine-monophosphate kinase
LLLASRAPRRHHQGMAKHSEFRLIDRLARATRVPRRDVVHGIGDDAAVLRVPARHELVVSMDTLISGVHFPENTAPVDIGWKTLAVNLSDMAAMGATPAWATLALTMPRGDARWIDAFARGFARLARQHNVALVGGDTTRGALSITVQAHGFVPQGRAVLRSGARVGHRVYVSGTLGDGAAGLALVQKRLRTRNAAAVKFLRARLDRPVPRVGLGVALRGIAGACIDVSDGLAQDLGHVLRASGVGAAIELSRLPVSRALRAVGVDDATLQRWQLGGGDDYELCFTAAPKHAATIAAIATRLRVPITDVGRIERGDALELRDNTGRPVARSRAGHDHFA